MSKLSGIKDLDHEIMLLLDDESLLNFCKIPNSYVKKLCKDEIFWYNRTYKKFGKIVKYSNKTWKELYLMIIYYTNKYSLFEILDKLYNKKENYDLYSYFAELAKNKIKETMIKELRMDLSVPKTIQDKLIFLNDHNINEAVNAIFGYHMGYFKELEHEATERDYNNFGDENVEKYRNYLYDYLDEDLLN